MGLGDIVNQAVKAATNMNQSDDGGKREEEAINDENGFVYKVEANEKFLGSVVSVIFLCPIVKGESDEISFNPIIHFNIIDGVTVKTVGSLRLEQVKKLRSELNDLGKTFPILEEMVDGGDGHIIMRKIDGAMLSGYYRAGILKGSPKFSLDFGRGAIEFDYTENGANEVDNFVNKIEDMHLLCLNKAQRP